VAVFSTAEATLRCSGDVCIPDNRIHPCRQTAAVDDLRNFQHRCISSTCWQGQWRLSVSRQEQAFRKPLSAHSATRRRCIKFGRRALYVAGPTAWNLLPEYLRDPSLTEDTFRR